MALEDHTHAYTPNHQCTCVQVVLDEISEPRITAILGHSLGILLVCVLGSLLDWKVVSAVSTAFPVLSLVAFILLPESPVWLVKRNRIEEAEKALTWLRGGGGIQVRMVGEECEL
jgi:SP family facilitated glucose transporter-like MFS transporter 8